MGWSGWKVETLPVRRISVFKGISMSLKDSKEHLLKLPCQNWMMAVQRREWMSLAVTN